MYSNKIFNQYNTKYNKKIPGITINNGQSHNPKFNIGASIKTTT